MIGDACCWFHMSLRLLTGMPSLKEMSFSAIQAVFWWTFRNLWGQQKCGLWGNKPAFQGRFLLSAYPGSSWEAAYATGAQLPCVQACLSVTVPGLVVLLRHCWSRSVAVLPCYFSPALMESEALSSSALERSKPVATLVQAEELPSNSTKLCGRICKLPGAQCLAHVFL